MLYKSSYGLLLMLLASFAMGEKLQIHLLNADGSATPPKDLKLDISWIGLAILSGPKGTLACTAVHTATDSVTLPRECLPERKLPGTLSIHYWNRSGMITKTEIPGNSLKELSNTPMVLVPLPKNSATHWHIAGDEPRKDEKWFGGFHPSWELVRVYSFEEDPKNRTFHFQVNTCKASTKAPVLRKIRPPNEDEDEEILNESKVISKDPAYTESPILEKCHRPFSSSSTGALITLARDFSQKIGFLVRGSFTGIHQRELASLRSPPKFDDGTLLRYIGADGLESVLPKDPSTIELTLAYPFETVHPKKMLLRP